jgi:diguanylate cyclase (GGDEF)-like protein
MTRTPDLRDQPPAARAFVVAVIVAGAGLLVAASWRRSFDQPLLFVSLLLLSVGASAVKIKLPVGQSVSTLSPGFAVNFASLLALGPGAAAWITTTGGWAQCTFNVTARNPWYRTLFSVSSLVLSMELCARVLAWTSGNAGSFAIPVAASAAAYFLCNSVLVATVVALSTRQSLLRVWDQEFLWGAPNYFVGAFVAAIIVRGAHTWGYGTLALLVPLFLTYRLYKVYLGRMDDERRHVRELSDMHLATVEALALAIEAKDATARSHVRRVQYYATELGRALALRPDLIEGIRIAALLHDVGKLGVPDHLLAKTGPLTPEEFARVCRYPEIGAEIVAAVPFPYPVAPFIRHHHERWDGTGYPDMIGGELIPLGARIIAIAERFDALCSERPYRPALSAAEAIAHIRHEAGSSLDPNLVAKFIDVLPTIEAGAVEDTHDRRVLDNISEAQGELVELFERARVESQTDVLTELPNRRFVQAHVARELTRAQRTGSSVAVLAIDMNDFKTINDRLGHGAGDIVLRSVGQCLRRGLRPHDVCGRYGGDEFVVVLSGSGPDVVALKSAELARSVQNLAIEAGGPQRLHVTVSIGGAVHPDDGETFDELFAAADARMYENKLQQRTLAAR